MFKHTCGNPALIDLSGILSFVINSISISPFGFNFGAAELITPSKSSGIKFSCQKCGPVTETGEILSTCMVCRRDLPLESLLTTQEIPIICTECVVALKEDNKSSISEEVISITSGISEN
jgi:hypothetical protein